MTAHVQPSWRQSRRPPFHPVRNGWNVCIDGHWSQTYPTKREAQQVARVHNMVEAVKAHALAHYEDGGWDVIVECWDDEQIADAIVSAYDPVKTPGQAIKHFGDGVVAVWADQQADARNSAF